MIVEQNSNIHKILKKTFGFTQFKGLQENVIHNVLSGKDTFVLMPTGGGKSLCYQLPAVMLGGVSIIISPLIALMKNQVDQLRANGIDARFLNSTLSNTQLKSLKEDSISGKVKMIYISPESLSKEKNLGFLKQCKVDLIAIDEAHCISEWGHDFRPEYRKIKDFISPFGNIPIIALTATATQKVRSDIQKALKIETAEVFISSFFRDNLVYSVRPKKDAKREIIKFIKDRHGSSGIIYCLSRKQVENLAGFLSLNGIKALPYHAGLEASERAKNQDAFLNEDVDVIVATIAFGMGIDKPDVRFVIHYDIPKSIEGYYQETGRAGRDGLSGECLLFYNPKDVSKLSKFGQDKTVSERDNFLVLLKEMEAYAKSSVCRPKLLLHYFGEEMVQDCSKCDNCKRKRVTIDGEVALLLLLNSIRLTQEKFGIDHIIKIILGTHDDYVSSYEHDKLEVFGKGKDLFEEKQLWEDIIRQSLIAGFLIREDFSTGELRLSKKGVKYLDNPYAINFFKGVDFSSEEFDTDTTELNSTNGSGSGGAADNQLKILLKSLRKDIAKKKNLPPYVIFQDPSLEEMATIYPTDLDQLSQINGVGKSKAERYGQPFCGLIKKYTEENEIITGNDLVIKSSVKKSKNKIAIIQQIDRKIDLEDISESIGVSYEELIKELEAICYSGTKLNLDYYIYNVLDEEKLDELYSYFLEAESDSISLALDEFEEDYSEEEIRLARIKFLSEVAM